MEFCNSDISRLSGYTYISKYIYKDKTLSLRAMGLLSWFFSCPPNWEFSETGIAAVHKDGVDSVKQAIKELVEKKYLIVKRERNEKGQVCKSNYKFFEIPYDIDPSSLETEFTELKAEDENCNVRVEQLPVTIMGNYHLRDKGMSLKAKGLLSLMFSIPPTWIFSEANLARLTSDKITKVRSAVKELKEHKYLTITQSRDERGQLSHSVYTFYRIPYDIDRTDLTPEADFPHTDKPLTGNPLSENPQEEKPITENPDQINTNTTKTIKNKDCFNNHHLPFEAETEEPAPKQSSEQVKMMIKEKIGFESIVSMNNELEEQMDNEEITLEYFNLCYVNPRYLNSIINAMTDVYCSTETEIKTGLNKTCSRYRIIENFEALNLVDIKNIIHKIIDIKPNNVRGFALTVINNYL